MFVLGLGVSLAVFSVCGWYCGWMVWIACLGL